MPRGVRTTNSIQDQISEIDEKIKVYKDKIEALNAKKKSLLALKEKADMDALFEAVKASGKTAAELIAELSK